MHSIGHRLTPIAPLFCALVLVAAPLRAQHVAYGAASPLGDGTVRTYLLHDADGRPLELGIAISDSAMATLPDLADKPDREAFLSYDLALPEGAPAPFRFAMFDWNPRGHEPVGIYTVPHFDFHFYMTDVATRNAIMPTDSAGTAFEQRGMKAPEEGYLPASYVNPGGTTVPMMGSHWIDPGSHEFHEQPFDKTFIYGTWDGQVIFVEPMITRAYLETRGDETIEIARPARYPSAGWYPVAYRARYDADAGEYRIALTDFSESR